MVDCIYIAASARDADYARICVASVRRIYPTERVELLPGSELDSRLVKEMREYWNVSITRIPPGRYGWGYVKLEPLFFEPGHRFLVLDSDTVVTGSVVERWSGRAPFLFDQEQQTDAEVKRLYYDWDAARTLGLNLPRPRFVANTGQWFGTAGVLSRSDFEPWLNWTMPRHVAATDVFKQGEQGLLNFVLNQGVAAGKFEVDRQHFMHWPAHGMNGLSVDAIDRRVAPAMVIHWAGLKRHRRSATPAADVLDYFERLYYARIPSGTTRRVLATAGRVTRAAIDGSLDHARLIGSRLARGRTA